MSSNPDFSFLCVDRLSNLVLDWLHQIVFGIFQFPYDSFP
ncbi:hypothetical protein AALP_AA5G093100 [Arabis alpina]|uniref:Uncharacterized protein n=1 Tax=Arabis alpina TaxID=50452 RepID=A0A087GVX9_ARAAL|nr:hypothetical protein AALP_AA5G093100 [Arabis alpina]